MMFSFWIPISIRKKAAWDFNTDSEVRRRRRLGVNVKITNDLLYREFRVRFGVY